LRGIIPNPILIVWFPILPLLVFPSNFHDYLISVACSWLLCLEDEGHDSHPYVPIGLYVVLYMVSFVLLVTSFLFKRFCFNIL
jgi:hypothetical protein